MKKLLSLVLTLALMLTLSAPALADLGYVPAPDADPVWTAWKAEYLAAHPDEAAAFDPDAWFAEHYEFYDSKEEFMKYGELATEAEFIQQMQDTWLSTVKGRLDSEARWAQYLVDEPADTARFLAEVEDFVCANTWSASLEDYKRDLNYSSPEEAYLGLYLRWKGKEAELAEAKSARDKRVSALGGVPGQINVLADGKCLAFGGKAPKLVDGALSVPADVLGKALGVQAKGDAEGYAPLRFTAESAGWDVLWDQEYETAVLLDKAALTANLQKEFTQLDALVTRLLEQTRREAGQSYRAESSADLALTLFDTLNGDKTYNVKLRGEAVVRDRAFSATLTVDAASLLGLVTADQVKALFGSGMSLSKLKNLAGSLKIEIIFDPQGEMLYVKAPALAQLTGGKVSELGEWLSLDLAGLVPAESVELPELSALLSSLICQQALSKASYGYGDTPIDFYDCFASSRAEYIAILGNGRFAEKNGALTYTLDAKTVNGLLRDALSGSYSAEAMGDMFKACDFTLSVGKDGQVDMKIDVESDYGQMGSYGPAALLLMGNLRYRAQVSGTAEVGKGSLEFHWQNRLKLLCDTASTVRPVGDAPRSAPAAGEKITPLEDLDDLLYEAGYEELYYLLP